ncbi:MAG: hypothetical protein JWO44_2722 [Bacteroidetes bacterium]|nr:hypothetical protein [Bacteroidota bacterium]
MKMKSLFGALICLTVVLASSCKRDKDSVPHVTVSPSALYIYGNVGDLVTFSISVDSESPLSKFYISQQPDNQVAVTVLDTSITSKGVNFTYYYRLPAALAGTSVIFEFKAQDENGNTGKELKRVFIATPAAVPLTETTGHRMYSNLGTNPDAYNLETNVSQFSTSDSTLRDVQDASGTDTTLSRNWISPAGGQFVAYNGFDYANATNVSTVNAYNGGVKLTQLSGLAVGDIIITKLGSLTTNKYSVIRITDIVDLPGKNNDYYEFSIKK